jgi:hypothetical protein
MLNGSLILPMEPDLPVPSAPPLIYRPCSVHPSQPPPPVPSPPIQPPIAPIQVPVLLEPLPDIQAAPATPATPRATFRPFQLPQIFPNQQGKF